MQLALEAAKSALWPLRGHMSEGDPSYVEKIETSISLATCAEPMTKSLFVEYPVRKCASVQVTMMPLIDLHHQAGPLFSSALW